MRIEEHIEAFEERKATIMKWALEVRGIEKSQRVIGDNASRAIIELLSAYLHKTKKIDEGFQLNHRWFKSSSVSKRLPEFDNKIDILKKIIELEILCEKLSYGKLKEKIHSENAIVLFNDLEESIERLMKND